MDSVVAGNIYWVWRYNYFDKDVDEILQLVRKCKIIIRPPKCGKKSICGKKVFCVQENVKKKVNLR